MLALPAALAEPAEQEQSAQAACPNVEHMNGVGPVCPRPDGLYEVFAPDGSSLGFIHGTDPRCDGCDEPVSLQGSTDPHCVAGTSTEYFVHVIYARAHDDADRYSTMADTIRNIVKNANAMVDDAAVATGDRLGIRVLCSGGTIVVQNEALPTSKGSASFSTIVDDLKNKGYNSYRQKYWVYYDDSSACFCAGTGHMYNDDSDSVNNYNNGYSGAVPMFAVSFDSNSVRTMLHELGHNLGAVQNSAPYSTGAGHCYDGRDTMCYNDGGPKGYLYSTSYCGTEIFDCNKNTYCHANPASGSYLDTHWQACSRHTRFLQYAANVAPVMDALTCSPSPSNAEETVTCSFSATDGNAGVYYTVDWGDGSTTRVPSSGTVSPGTTQSASHTWMTQGDYVVSVTATDSGSPPATSAAITHTQTVAPPNDVPVMVSLSCSPLAVAEGEDVTCTFQGTDATHEISYNVAWGEGTSVRVPATGTVPSGTTRTAVHAYAGGGSFDVTVTVTDNGSPPKTSGALTQTISVTEINGAPVMQTLTCPTAALMLGRSASCTFRATDDSTAVQYKVEWGDGAVTYVPASGYTAPGVDESASHAYTVEGEHTVTVTATDDFVPPATSAAITATVSVQADQDGPAVSASDPRRGQLYIGCAAQYGKVAGEALLVTRGCVRASASDVSGVVRVEVLYGGTVLATVTTAPYVIEFPTPGVRVGAQFEVRAVDTLGNARSVTFIADTI